MDKVRLIYNPLSGENIILNQLDIIMKMNQKKGYQVIPYRVEPGKSVKEALDDIDQDYKYILIAGGDGTIDSVVNGMMEKNIDLPIAILPVGTANDFAKYLNIPRKFDEALEKILSSKPVPIDVAKINDKYFINVASTGLFTEVSQKTDINLKNTIGKLAYYLKGLEELPNFRRLKIRITSEEINYEGDMYLLLVFNGQTAGNFRLANRADIKDGYLDVLVIKAVPVLELLPLFFKLLRREHLDSNKVIYFKTKKLRIESSEDILTDIDGEKGPEFPLNIECIHNGIKILGIK